MSTPQTAMTFSMSEDVKQDITRISKQQQSSKSAVFRDMYRAYKFDKSLSEIQTEGRAIALKLGIETDDDVVDYIKSKGKFAPKR